MACSTRKKLVRWCRISAYEEKDDMQCLETGEGGGRLWKYVNPSILIYVQLKRSKADIRRGGYYSYSETGNW